ncbi:MAG TPA: DUF962 domain-containing protein [Polyangia bacterium]|nr:DUF962 domain-containing protein [Polyangia bacterium]
MSLMTSRSWDEWISEYAEGHQNPKNRFCHTVGIPMIAVSIPLFVLSPFVAELWLVAVALFAVGWVFQFVGHAFEGKPPEFLKDWRFLFVGVRWWLAKIRGRA